MLSFVVFLLLLGTLSLAGFVYLLEPGPQGRVAYLRATGKLLLYRYSLVDSLKPREVRRLYKSSCTRKCHGKAVVEDKPRTAMEWELIVERMGKPDRADLSFTESRTIVEFLQRNYLSNVPTILPDYTMRFLKKHLWRLDFGDSDLYFDVIYMPKLLRRFMPYLALKARPTDTDEALFIVYLNTHSGMIPDWNLGDIAVLRDDRGNESKAVGWDVLYEDVDKHHRQGILTFPEAEKDVASLELVIRPSGVRERAYMWNLPIPDYKDPAPKDKTPKKAEGGANQ